MECSICLDLVSQKTRPSTCSHDFCLECILEWTRVSNICPLCKQVIVQLDKYDCSNRLLKTIAVAAPANSGAAVEESQFAEVCYRCRQVRPGDDILLIVCDQCNFNVVHYECLGFQTVPTHDWFCDQCSKQRVNVIDTHHSDLEDLTTATPTSPETLAVVKVSSKRREEKAITVQMQ